MSLIEDYLDALSEAGPELEDELVRAQCEDSLYEFLKEAWPAFDPAPFVGGWHLEAICLPGDVTVLTEDGVRPIKDLVQSEWRGKVASFNHQSGEIEWRRVLNKMASHGKTIVKIITSSGLVLRCTEGHPVYSHDRGYISAGSVAVGDILQTLRYVRENFPPSAQPYNVLPPGMLGGKSGEAANGSDAKLPFVWQEFLSRDVSNGRRLLRVRLHGCGTEKTRDGDLRRLRKSEGAKWISLSKMLRKVTQFAAELSMRALRKVCEQITRPVRVNAAQAGSLLQHEMFRSPHPRREQSCLHRRRSSGDLPHGISDDQKESTGARWSCLFSMFRGWQNRCSPYRQGQVQQRHEQSGFSLSDMPQCPEGDAIGGMGESRDVVVSVSRELRIPKTVFNLEVEGNNNYFAAGVLVHNCEHLQAVTDGHIRKLLINVRPRSGKTGLVAVAWPAWTWTLKQRSSRPLAGPGVRFLCGSYGANKAQEDGVTARRLIGSAWYQRLWGDRFQVSKDRDNQERYDTTAGGSRINTGIPESLGKGGMIRLLDDPHKTSEVESDTVRDAVIRGYKEIWSTRANDPAIGAEVMIMQRQAEGDLSGYWLENYGSELVHLCIPAWHEDDRRCATYVRGHEFWEDPREREGESFWPARYPPTERKVDEALGPYAFAGQIQQRPEPRGGGIIRREWWQPWPPDNAIEHWTNSQGRVSYPPWEFVLGYLDTAFTKKEQNDWSAFTRWGVFADDVGRPRTMLAGAWRERLNFRELITKTSDSCRAGKVDVLVIENKAGGIWVAEEIMKEMRNGEWQVVLDTPVTDKVARAHAVVPLFIDNMVYAPFMHDAGVWRDWVEMVVSEVEKFPKARHDDLVDTCTGSLGYLRRNDLIRLSVEHDEDERAAKVFHGNGGGVAALYEVD